MNEEDDKIKSENIKQFYMEALVRAMITLRQYIDKLDWDGSERHLKIAFCVVAVTKAHHEALNNIEIFDDNHLLFAEGALLLAEELCQPDGEHKAKPTHSTIEGL